MRYLLFFLLSLFFLPPFPTFSQPVIPHAKLEGKYEFAGGGLVIQFTTKKEKLFLITPGAPLQEMKRINRNEYQSKMIKDGVFHFIEENDTVNLISKNSQGSMQAKKISGQIEDYSETMDSVLPLKKRSKHFEFHYSNTDKHFIDSLTTNLEGKYNKILADFNLKSLPLTKVKIYSDLKTFHLAINSPGAPPQVLATAFGKNEFRMASPTTWGDEAGTMIQNIIHEFTHCVHLNIDYSPNNPRWLWEGVAMYEADWFLNPGEIEQIKKREFPALKDLNNGLEYMLGYVIIEAIKDKWSFSAVINLIKNQGNTQKVLGITDKEFEEIVFNSIYQKYITK
jgi:hypothetical protein